MKKIGILFATVILMMFFAVSANALEPTGQCGDNVYWSFDEGTGELVISGTGPMWDYEGHAPLSPFNKSEVIKKIVFEDGISYIGNYTFNYCLNLTSISFPESLESIGGVIFYESRNIRELDFSKTNLKHIEKGAFGCCSGLKYIHLPNTVEYIGSGSFFTTYLDYIYYVGTEDEWNVLVENYVDSESPPYLQIPEKIFVDVSHLKNIEIEIVEPTCISEGNKTTKCLCGCNYTYTESLPKLQNHIYNEVVTVPTCKNRGYTTYTCSCGDTYVDNYVEPTDHKDDNADNKCDFCSVTLKEPEEKTFFEKIIDFFKNIFDKLFGWLR